MLPGRGGTSLSGFRLRGGLRQQACAGAISARLRSCRAASLRAGTSLPNRRSGSGRLASLRVLHFRHASTARRQRWTPTGPAFEFNWGAIPRVQLHAILPWGVIAPSNNPVYLPGGAGPTHFGLTDMELGAKIAFIKEGKHMPQIGSFTMFEMPTGNADNGLGVGKVWYKLPIWLQKNSGKWLFDGGGGYQVVPQTGLPQLSLHRMAGQARTERAVGAGRGGFRSRRGGPRRGADGGFGDDRHRRLLPLQAQSQPADSLLLTATRWPDKPRTTPTWACTGHGAKTRSTIRQTRRKMRPVTPLPHAAESKRPLTDTMYEIGFASVPKEQNR